MDTLNIIHFIIFIATIVLIVVMLIPKIIIDYCKIKRKENNQRENTLGPINEEEDLLKDNFILPNEQKGEQTKGLSDLIVTAAIETIEFVLGTVSNTASYLRLWALSLAHSQLANVFFQYSIIKFGNKFNEWYINGIILIALFPIFAGVTALVLLFMDLMECFLHTLRLHWVEFQNKFFRADGYQFKPFCFAQSIELKEDEFEKNN